MGRVKGDLGEEELSEAVRRYSCLYDKTTPTYKDKKSKGKYLEKGRRTSRNGRRY